MDLRFELEVLECEGTATALNKRNKLTGNKGRKIMRDCTKDKNGRKKMEGSNAGFNMNFNDGDKYHENE